MCTQSSIAESVGLLTASSLSPVGYLLLPFSCASSKYFEKGESGLPPEQGQSTASKALAEDADTFLPLFTSLLAQPAWDPAAFERLRSDAIEHLTNGVMSSDEVLGDMLAPIDAALALKVYYASGVAHEKVMNCLLKTQQFDRIVFSAVGALLVRYLGGAVGLVVWVLGCLCV